ncbi:MAG TPA: AMMECR1 domain-containing protein [Abditibacteriaceae bacterium]|jgi:hypothetical protein
MKRTLLLLCLLLFSHVTRADDWQTPSVQRAALALSRRAMTHYFATGTTLTLPRDVPSALRKRGALFVTIEKQGQIQPRGCRGTIRPNFATIGDEIIRNSLAALTRDATQPPLRRDELARCRISLTLVQRVSPIQNPAQSSEEFGLVARAGERWGVVLPYEGRDQTTRAAWARRKAGLPSSAAVEWLELRAVRFRE